MIDCNAVECLQSNKIICYTKRIDGDGATLEIHPCIGLDALQYSLIQTRIIYNAWTFAEMRREITITEHFLSPSALDLLRLIGFIFDGTFICTDCSKLIAEYVIGEVY
jgi:hypothetical protein